MHDNPAIEGRFLQERSRLMTALGTMMDGGVIEDLRLSYVSTSDEPDSTVRLEIGLAVWPFPLEGASIDRLASLEYTAEPEAETSAGQRLQNPTESFNLYIMEAGSETWTNYLVLNAYLRNHAFDQASADLMPAARQWWIDRQGFTPLQQLTEELKEFNRPWCVASGWAIQLFLGRVTRLHGDVDILIARSDQLALQTYMTERGWKLIAPYEGKLVPWPPHMRLELPRHQVHGHRDGQFIDLLLGEIEQGLWRFRRNPAIVRTMDRAIIQGSEGISFLAPEIVLLFKSRTVPDKVRQKDCEDFEHTFPLLEAERRAWLQWALTVLDPDHPWIARLNSIVTKDRGE